MATLQVRLSELAVALGADIKELRLKQGDLTALSTTAKLNLVQALNEVYELTMNGTNIIDDAANPNVLNKTYSVSKILDSINFAITTLRDELTNGASAALDTFKELADALGNNPNFAQELALTLSRKVSYDPQAVTAADQLQARTNIGAQSAADIGNTDQDLVAIYVQAKS